MKEKVSKKDRIQLNNYHLFSFSFQDLTNHRLQY